MSIVKLAKDKENKYIKPMIAGGLLGAAALTALAIRKHKKVPIAFPKDGPSKYVTPEAEATFKNIEPEVEKTFKETVRPIYKAKDNDRRYESYLHKKYGRDPYAKKTGRSPMFDPSMTDYKHEYNNGQDSVKRAYQGKMAQKQYAPFGDRSGAPIFGARDHAYNAKTPRDVKAEKRQIIKKYKKSQRAAHTSAQEAQYNLFGRYLGRKKSTVIVGPPPSMGSQVKPLSVHFDLNHVKSTSDLKKHFRELAKKHHPDMGGDPERFRSMNEDFNSIKDSRWYKKLDKPRKAKKSKKMGLITLSRSNK